MTRSFSIRDISADPGTKKDGFLSIQDDDAGTVRLLIGIVNGSKPGPVVCVTGGMYGTIYTGIDACIRLYNDLDPSRLKGTVITVPVIEMTGFQQCMDYSPIDGLNPNKIFPGDPNGTITHRISDVVFNEAVRKSEYHLDLRGGDLWEQLHTFTIFHQTGNRDFDQKSEKLARALGTEYYLITPDTKGSLICEASRIGITSVILEASRGLATYEEEDVRKNLKAMHNMLKYLGMIEGRPETANTWIREEFQMHLITAKQGGLLYLNCACGDIASEGQKLGEIRNLRGEVLQELIAPIDGLIHYIFPKHIKRPGERVVGMRRILE